jgi:S-adenosylmethionine:diacylglycerol 3-amino-3-carboxypropyl transferase
MSDKDKGIGIAILAAKEASKTDKKKMSDEEEYDTDEDGEELFSDLMDAIESGDKSEGYMAFKALMSHCRRDD